MYKTYSGKLTRVNMPDNGVFVFGSNPQGRHGMGAAHYAYAHFGAIYGWPRGRQGNSYAIVTKELRYQRPPISNAQIIKEIVDLYGYAESNPDELFYIAYSGTGTNLNGRTPQEMARLFAKAGTHIPDNIVFEEEFTLLVQQS